MQIQFLIKRKKRNWPKYCQTYISMVWYFCEKRVSPEEWHAANPKTKSSINVYTKNGLCHDGSWSKCQIQISKFAFYPSVDDLIVLAYGAVYILRYTIMDKT